MFVFLLEHLSFGIKCFKFCLWLVEASFSCGKLPVMMTTHNNLVEGAELGSILFIFISFWMVLLYFCIRLFEHKNSSELSGTIPTQGKVTIPFWKNVDWKIACQSMRLSSKKGTINLGETNGLIENFYCARGFIVYAWNMMSVPVFYWGRIESDCIFGVILRFILSFHTSLS